MNERIKQLAKEAGMIIVDDKFSTYGKFAEKFAELIVWECSQISRDHQRNYYESHGDRIAKKIKEHFGVKE